MFAARFIPKRRLARVLAAVLVAVLMFIGATFIWPVIWSDPARRIEIRIGVGRVMVMWERGVAPVGWNPEDKGGWRRDAYSPWHYGLWFNWDHMVSSGGIGAMTLLRVPLWTVVLITAVPLAWTLRKRPRQLCPYCKYSLAGLPEGARCPECGRTSDS